MHTHAIYPKSFYWMTFSHLFRQYFSSDIARPRTHHAIGIIIDLYGYLVTYGSGDMHNNDTPEILWKPGLENSKYFNNKIQLPQQSFKCRFSLTSSYTFRTNTTFALPTHTPTFTPTPNHYIQTHKKHIETGRFKYKSQLSINRLIWLKLSTKIQFGIWQNWLTELTTKQSVGLKIVEYND